MLGLIAAVAQSARYISRFLCLKSPKLLTYTNKQLSPLVICLFIQTKRATLEKYLAELGVSYRTYEHPPAFTVEELLHHVSSIEGLHAKNLLVKDKKSKLLYLITARHDANVKLDKVAKLVGAKELRFADAETLEKSLGVTQGSVVQSN